MRGTFISARPELGHEWVMRLLALRRAGRVGIPWVEADVWHISESEYDPWGSRRYFSIDELRRLIVQLEADQCSRKQPATLQEYQQFHNDRTFDGPRARSAVA